MINASGGSVNEADNDGCTPLHTASQNGHLEVARVLIEAQANVNQKYQDWTPLHIAINKGHYDIAALLRGAGGHE
mgnify:CR=1 FL=1